MSRFIGNIALLLIVSLSVANSQIFKFPVATNFQGCIKPTEPNQTLMNSHIAEYYKYWKKKYLIAAGSTAGGYYIAAQGTGGSNTITVSEAHGYGMIIFALMAGMSTSFPYNGDGKEQFYFDGMLKFFLDHLCESGDQLMSWQILGGTSWESKTSDGTATDGDLDIAYALALAHCQWKSDGNNNYLQESEKVINSIKKSEIGASSKRVLVGDWTSNMHASRPSDWMTGHFEVFGKITGDPFWGKVINECYQTYNQFISSYSSRTGLISDFIDGVTPRPYDYYETGAIYGFDACRVPWRLATDYAHNGRSQAKVILNKITEWLIPKTLSDPSNVVYEYRYNGTAIGKYNSSAFLGPFLCATIAKPSTTSCNYQKYLNDGWSIMKPFRADYYEDTIQLLNMLLISGNWWKPNIITPINKTKEVSNKMYMASMLRKNNAIYLICSGKPKTSVAVTMTDVFGKTIQKTNMAFDTDGMLSKKLYADETQISTGIYFVNISSQQNNKTIKLIL